MRHGIFYAVRRKGQVLTQSLTSPEFVSKIYFRYTLGYKFNLKNPQTFNEKLQWLKLFYWPNNLLAIQCADKYRVREYMKSRGYGEYVNDLIGVWDCVEEID